MNSARKSTQSERGFDSGAPERAGDVVHHHSRGVEHAQPVDDRKSAAVGRLTGLAYTLKNAEMRARVRDVTRGSYDAGAEWLRAFDANDLPMPADQLVRVIHCLIEGLVMQRILTPELCPDEVFYAAFGALVKR